MIKILHVIVGRLDLKVDFKECMVGYSGLMEGIVTLACESDRLILAALRLIESGVPATVPASYPCGPGGPLGEVVMHAPAPCNRLPVKGVVRVYCSDPGVCGQLGRAILNTAAPGLRFAKAGNAWILEAKIERGGYLDLSLLERINRKSLEAIIVSPVRIPPLDIKFI
jgi:hypothetical protein